MATLITAVPPGRLPGAVPTGAVGRCLARRLLAVGEAVRVLAPRQESAGWPPGTDVIEGSVLSPAESPQAFSGVERVFLAGATHETRTEEPSTACEVVRRVIEGGARRIVVLSSHGPVFEAAQPPERWVWLGVERAVEASSASWVHIRPSAVMANMLDGGYPPTGSSWAQTVRRERVIREPNGDAGYPFIDEDDLAAIAATALFEDAYVGSVVEAMGPPISARERAALIADAIGDRVRFEELTPHEARALWRSQGWPEETIEVTLWAQAQFLAHPTDLDQTTVQVLGRAPRTFAQWLASHVEAFR